MTKALHLQPVTAIHTTPGYETEMSPTISPALLYIFSGVAILIQLIACINFMNLSTARASRRAKEVGVRKIIGAERADLVKQFLGESFILTLIAVLLAVPLLYVALPYLNQLTNANIQLTFPGLGMMWLALLVIILVTGGLAGSYPAFYLSAFQAIRVIKGNFTNNTGGTMTGVDVSFGLGGTFALSGGTSLNLAAPGAASSYGIPGLLLATKSTADTSIGGGSSNQYAGLIYAPKSDMSISGGASMSASGSACMMLIVSTLSMTGSGATSTGTCSALSGATGPVPSVSLFR